MNLTKQQFLLRGQEISTAVGVQDSMHAYFRSHASRMYESIKHFGLLSGNLGDVLEIGPFYGYLPFFLKENAESYTVLEGDDPAVYPLLPFYRSQSIECSCVDLFELFGPTHSATHTLPLPGATYDTLLCWETMEHFGFNPVKFVRELHRVLKPGGKVYITVPNRASFQALFGVLFGRGEKQSIQEYYKFENYESNGKNAFYGFHWREYSSLELRSLFTRAGFMVTACSTFTTFQDHDKMSVIRRIARKASSCGSAILPRYGTHVFLVAEKASSRADEA